MIRQLIFFIFISLTFISKAYSQQSIVNISLITPISKTEDVSYVDQNSNGIDYNSNNVLLEFYNKGEFFDWHLSTYYENKLNLQSVGLTYEQKQFF